MKTTEKQLPFLVRDGNLLFCINTNGKSWVVAKVAPQGEPNGRKIRGITVTPKTALKIFGFRGKAILKGSDVFSMGKGVSIAIRNLKCKIENVVKSSLGKQFCIFRGWLRAGKVFRKPASVKRSKERDLLEFAWSIIANAGGANWEKERPDWTEAAVRFRDSYHKLMFPANIRSKPAKFFLNADPGGPKIPYELHPDLEPGVVSPDPKPELDTGSRRGNAQVPGGSSGSCWQRAKNCLY